MASKVEKLCIAGCRLWVKGDYKEALTNHVTSTSMKKSSSLPTRIILVFFLFSDSHDARARLISRLFIGKLNGH